MNKIRTLIIVLAVSQLMSWCQTVAADESVTINEIARVWEQTKIAEITCKLQLDNTSWSHEKTDDSPKDSNAGGYGMGGMGMGGKSYYVDPDLPPKKSTLNYTFLRHAGFGMRQTSSDGTSDDNVFENKGIRVIPGGETLIGMNSVLVDKAGDTMIQASSTTISLLDWLDPLVTNLGTRIGRLEKGKTDMVSDPVLGPTARFNMHDGQKSIEVVLAKAYDWRPISINRTTTGKLISSQFFEYRRSDDGKLLLTNWVSSRFVDENGETKLRSTEEAFISDWKFTCNPDDLKVEIPVFSLVVDSSDDSVGTKRYLVRKDGSIRNVDRDERKLASGWQELYDTEDGELFGNQPTDKRGFWWIAAGVVVVGLGFVLFFRRQ